MSGSPVSTTPVKSGARAAKVVSNTIFALGLLLLVAAALYAGYALMNTWLIGQQHYLTDHNVLPIPVPAMTFTPSPTPTATPTPTIPPTPTPIPSPTPTATPTPPPAPVQIRIPALGITRSIIPLPKVRDRATGSWTWDTKKLFRSGRSDLVGHWEGTAFPGQPGNMILVGHNYGYGYNGVFVRLGSLKPGSQVIIVNKAGQTFTYKVTSVNRVKWRTQSFGELAKHLEFLAPGGPEQVTLVSCAGADVEPFPERIYVVAEPVK